MTASMPASTRSSASSADATRRSPAVAALNNLFSLGPVSGAQDIAELADRPHRITTAVIGASVCRRER
jgi:hypothetical protein